MSTRAPVLFWPSARRDGVRSARAGAARQASSARAAAPLVHRHCLIQLPPLLGVSPPPTGRCSILACWVRTRGRLMAGKLDAIILGAGHNGLVTACYLARAGWRVLVLERRHVVGGACVTEET